MPSPESFILPGLIGSFVGGGGVAGLLRVRPDNRKKDAESAQVLASAYAILVEDLRKQVELLRADMTQLKSEREIQIGTLRQELILEKAENSRLRERVVRLEAKLETLSPSTIADV